jgi:hypothetical protein
MKLIAGPLALEQPTQVTLRATGTEPDYTFNP